LKTKGKEIQEELNTLVSGKTFYALLSPVVFLIVNGIFDLGIALVADLGLTLL